MLSEFMRFFFKILCRKQDGEDRARPKSIGIFWGSRMFENLCTNIDFVRIDKQIR